ncbi:hypothetical protein [Mesorhizobium sophorae]|uniref:hypothetical protein n=1 Tax=Mesorhizobium sophorae TaxID=1300294 RepID=UPI000BA40A30|nr:hypothetical protein [Mesorhizobium sophorae]
MISHVHFDLAPPKSWDQFEELCADTFQEEWQDPAMVRHGRAGQAQHGIDIVGRNGALWPIGIQCKKKSIWPVTVVTTKDLDAEVEKAKAFKPKLKAFYLVSTAPDDQPLQEYARTITERHQQWGLFPVVVLGWSEVVRRATRHQQVAAKHFGSHSTGPASPLLATWPASAAKLQLNDRELGISIREIMHDLIDFPEGRVVVRQQESEDLLFEIKKLQATTSRSLKGREAVLELRDKFKARRDREVAVIKALRLLLGHKIFCDLMWVAWDDQAPLLVRSLVEQGLDPNFSTVTGLEKIRIYPPDHPPGFGDDQSIAVFMPGAEVGSIVRNQWHLQKQFPNLETDNIGEMPRPVQFRYAIPAVIREVMWKLENGVSLEEMERLQWNQMHRWRISNRGKTGGV